METVISMSNVQCPINISIIVKLKCMYTCNYNLQLVLTNMQISNVSCVHISERQSKTDTSAQNPQVKDQAIDGKKQQM